MRDGGKGDTPRPLGVSIEQFDKNFEAIFGKKKAKQQYKERKEQVLYDPRDKTDKVGDDDAKV